MTTNKMTGVNRHRGEIAATLGGMPYRLCLTLGGLAELEDHFACGDLVSLSERFETGRLSARDCLAIILTGLNGGGHEMDEATLAGLAHEKGAAGYVAIVADLLAATFGGGEDAN